MKIETEIKYTLIVDKENGHGINYQANSQNDIAAMMISIQVLNNNIDVLKEHKKQAKGKEKKYLSEQINKVGGAVMAISKLAEQILDGYEEYMAAVEMKKKKEALTNL